MVSTARITIFAVIALCIVAPSLAVIEGCATNSTDSTGREICATCATGYFRSQGGFYCNICPSGCASCDSQGYCQSCRAGTYLVNGLCESCGLSCASCNGATCAACIFGYSLINNNCVRCIDNCDNCDVNGYCVSCRDGYNLRTNNNGNNFGNGNGNGNGGIQDNGNGQIFVNSNTNANTNFNNNGGFNNGQYCELDDEERFGKALITLITFGIICCLPMVVCCFCFYRLGASFVNGPAGPTTVAYNPNPFVNMNAQPINTGYGPGYY